MIVYEPHPVTPERKAELRAAGYKIIDARFAPEPVDMPRPVEVEINADPAPVEPPKRGRKAKA